MTLDDGCYTTAKIHEYVTEILMNSLLLPSVITGTSNLLHFIPLSKIIGIIIYTKLYFCCLLMFLVNNFKRCKQCMDLVAAYVFCVHHGFPGMECRAMKVRRIYLINK